MKLAAWLASPLLRGYVRDLVFLWILAKAMLVAGALANAVPLALTNAVPPFAFRPAHEAIACSVELAIIAHLARRRGEDVLLGNFGLAFGDALAPLVVVHILLSAMVDWIGT